MAELRRVSDPSRMIVEYDVFETDSGWRAVHQVDPELIFEGGDWQEMFAQAWAARVARNLRISGGWG